MIDGAAMAKLRRLSSARVQIHGRTAAIVAIPNSPEYPGGRFVVLEWGNGDGAWMLGDGSAPVLLTAERAAAVIRAVESARGPGAPDMPEQD